MNTSFGGVETAFNQPSEIPNQNIQPVIGQPSPFNQAPIIQQPVQPPVQQPPVQQPPVQQPPVQQPPVQQPPVQQPVSSTQNIINVVSQNQQQQAGDENFVPKIRTGQSPICVMSPGKFDAFTKVLSVLDDHNVIIIENSEICQLINNGTAILMTDISNLINDTANKINIHILSPKKYIKYFKNIKGNSDIHIINDAPNQRYIVTNGDMTIYLPKQIEAFAKDATPPDLSQIQPIGVTLEIDKETRNIISTMSSDSSHIDLIIHDNQFKGVYIPETAVFSFKQFIKEQIDESMADLRLRSFSFLKVNGDEYKVTLGVINGNYWIMTLINTGFVIVSILESLQPVSDEKLII